MASLREPSLEERDYLSSAEGGGAGRTGGDHLFAQLGAPLARELEGDLGHRLPQQAGGAAAAGVEPGARRLANLAAQGRGEQRARSGQLLQVASESAGVVEDRAPFERLRPAAFRDCRERARQVAGD